MLAIEVELLTGRYVATSHNDRRRAEWPPHPARFFSALVAALHDREPVDADERLALLWLERQSPPSLDVELDVDERVGRRDVHDVFVPVNDVSVVGDIWAFDLALNAARERHAAAQGESDPKLKSKAVNDAIKAIDKAEKKLAQATAPASKTTDVALEAATALMPERRTRQVRTLPVAVPARTVFAFVWADSPDERVRTALDALCARVTRLGHSSSLVRCTLVERSVTPTLVPSVTGDLVLRVVGDGQVDRLDREFERHQAVEARALPARGQRYAPPREAERERDAVSGVFSAEWIVYQRRGGARLRSSRGADLARALRAALLEANGSAGPLPAVLSGHHSEGEPSKAPHLAFVACPDVGHPHADGGVLGCAIVLPFDLPAGDRRALMRLIAAWEQARGTDGIMELGGEALPPVRLERVDLSERQALQPWRWCRASTRFVTATPIALDRHPGNLRSNQDGTAHKAAIEAQRCIADACERIGLPRPTAVEISLAPFLEGAQPVREFRTWPGKPGRPGRARVHARIDFDRDVRGPVLLGAGRFFGLGLCLPVWHDGVES